MHDLLIRRRFISQSLSLAAIVCTLYPCIEAYAESHTTPCDLVRYQFNDRAESAPHLIRWASELKFYLAMPTQALQGSSDSALGSPINRILSNLDNIPPAISAFPMVLFDIIQTPNTTSTEARSQKEANAIVKVGQELFSLLPLGLGERRVLFPSGLTFDKRCVLQMMLKGDIIQTAEIDLHRGITEAQTQNCMRELMWRAYGFTGLKEDDPNAGNAIASQGDALWSRKKEMLALLYQPHLKAGMSESDTKATLHIASTCN